MGKFNVTMDRKEEIWARYSAIIETDTLEKAQKELKRKVENDEFDDEINPIAWKFLDETNHPISQIENFAMSEIDMLIPDPQFYSLEGYEVIDFEDELNYEIED